MNKRQSISLTTLGYLLSPLSWWNDIFLNIPVSYVLAMPFFLISRNVFYAAFITIYWLTNLAGLLLMHLGMAGLKEKKQVDFKKDLMISIVITLLYSIILILLIRFGILRFPTAYLKI